MESRYAQLDGFLDWRAQKQVYEDWIKLSLPPGYQDRHSLRRAAPAAVATGMSDCVKGVRDRYDASSDWNPLSFQVAWISLAIPPFMV